MTTRKAKSLAAEMREIAAASIEHRKNSVKAAAEAIYNQKILPGARRRASDGESSVRFSAGSDSVAAAIVAMAEADGFEAERDSDSEVQISW